jgi:hypothetical protein
LTFAYLAMLLDSFPAKLQCRRQKLKKSVSGQQWKDSHRQENVNAFRLQEG